MGLLRRLFRLPFGTLPPRGGHSEAETILKGGPGSFPLCDLHRDRAALPCGSACRYDSARTGCKSMGPECGAGVNLREEGNVGPVFRQGRATGLGHKTLIWRDIPVGTRCGRQVRRQTAQSMGLGMTGILLKSWIVAGMTCVTLAACEPGTGNAPLTDGADVASGDAQPATSVRLVDHDVEAPEVFQTSDKGLWDGRPSLGGVWVASPDAKNPERVIMRNPANGKFVIGGLFQRDASLPGPKLQLSSDAADALGLVAGEPAMVSITALRREEAGAPTPDASKPLLDANESVGGSGQTDVVATATAALDGVADKSGKPETGKPFADTPVMRPLTPINPSAKPAAEPAAPQGTGALIQIGIFSVEANAKRAADVLAKAGIAATTSKESSHGKDLWSVTTRGDAALLAKIKSAGFKDAYVLKR